MRRNVRTKSAGRRATNRLGLGLALCWAALVPAEAIVINEIMYHPAGADETDYEWVELYNDYVVPLDISGWSLAGGITLAFPDGTVMAGKSYLVICANKTAMKERYGISDDKLMGAFEGRLDNGGEQVAVLDGVGGVLARVRYRDREPWPAGADGTGHSLALINPDLENDESESWAVSPQPLGSPGEPNGFKVETVVKDTVLIGVGESWSYFKGTEQPSDPPNAWNEPDFDDSEWLSGPTGIGYGDNDDATVLNDMSGSYISVFCRKKFHVSDVYDIETLMLKVDFDDGFIAYVNGDEVGRRNMGSVGEVFTYEMASRGSVGNLPESAEISVAKSLLFEGENTLAIQIHNSSLTSSDVSMIPSLVSRTVKTIGGVTPLPVVINEFLANPAAGEDTFVELFNNSGSDVDIGMAYLSDDPEALTRYRIPQDTVLLPWSHIAFTSSEMGFALSPGDGAIYLTSSDTERIIDAYAYGAALPQISRGRHPDGEEQWYNMLEPTLGEPNRVSLETSIVINEIMYHTYENDNKGEYIELYNRGTEAVDLSGWSFTNGVDFTFPPGTILQPDEYLAVAKSRRTIEKRYRIANVIGDYGGNLDNEGEEVELSDFLGNIVDEVRYAGGGRWPIWAAGWSSSLELIDPRQDNRAASAWAASDERDRGVWTHVEYTGELSGGEAEFHFFLMHRGECLIDDISLTREGEEYIPNGSFESGTSSWKIEGNHIQSTIYTEDAHSGSRCLKIIATGRGDTGANRIECDTTRYLQGGAPYTVSFWVKWQRGINLIYTRTHNQGVPKATRFPMPSQRGTPGKRNSVYSPNLGPVIAEVTQSPIVPKSNDPVRVRARISDFDGVSSVVLYYKGDYDGSFNSVPMYDDGGHGDGRADNGLYVGEIPARGSTALMKFCIVATDTRSASQRFPANDDTYCLYQIEDSAPSTKFPIYRILLSNEVEQELRTRNRLSNELADCTFVLNDTQIYYNCGIRTRGSGWTRQNHPANQYRIRFPVDQPLRGVQREINLDWHGDGTKQHDRTVHYLLRKLGGVPTSYHRYAHVRFNASFRALAEDLLKVDGDFVRLFWPDDAAGTLFKVDDHFEWTDGWSHSHVDAYLKWQAEEDDWDEAIEKEKYRWNWKLRTNEKKDDYSDFLHFVYFMDPTKTSDTSFEYEADRMLDVEAWLKVLCVRFLVDDWDTLGYDRGKNAYIYKPYHDGDGTSEDPPREGLWTLLAFDSDLTFSNASAPIVSSKFPSIQRMLETPKYQRLYYSYYMKLIDGPFSRAQIDPVLDGVYTMFSGESGTPSSPSSMKSFISSRISVIRSKIPQSDFAITTNSGEDFTIEEPWVTLQGTAPVTARTMTLRIGDAPETPFWPAWTGTMTWQSPVLVPPGENLLEFTARDMDGNFVGNTSITITRRLSPTEDSDSDGLYDREEAEEYHTDYLNPDTDGDTLSDGDEVHVYLTNPTDSDTDGDGLPDGEEVHVHLTDPNNADSDGDGMNDGDELFAGTDPTDETSVFAIVDVTQNGEAGSVRWISVPGRDYRVYGSSDLMNWSLLKVITAESDTTGFLDEDALNGAGRFYKVEVVPLLQ